MTSQEDLFEREASTPTDAQIANQIVEIVQRHGLAGVRPEDWDRQHRAALRLVRRYQADSVKTELAARGMREAQPLKKFWDVFDLERAWSKALAAGRMMERRERARQADRDQQRRADQALDRTSERVESAVRTPQYPRAPVIDIEGLKKFARERERRGLPIPSNIQKELERHDKATGAGARSQAEPEEPAQD